jgi:hypothetical protein
MMTAGPPNGRPQRIESVAFAGYNKEIQKDFELEA